MMKTSTKLEVKSQRPKRYMSRDAGGKGCQVDCPSPAKRAGGAGVGRGLTDAESEKEEQRDGMGAQAPVQVALLWLLGSVFHCGKIGERVSVGKDVFHKTSVDFGELSFHKG